MIHDTHFFTHFAGNAASAAASLCHFAAVAINYKEACDGDHGWSRSRKCGLESQK